MRTGGSHEWGLLESNPTSVPTPLRNWKETGLHSITILLQWASKFDKHPPSLNFIGILPNSHWRRPGVRTVGVQPNISATTFKKLGRDWSSLGHYTVTVSEQVWHASPQPKLVWFVVSDRLFYLPDIGSGAKCLLVFLFLNIPPIFSQYSLNLLSISIFCRWPAKDWPIVFQ